MLVPLLLPLALQPLLNIAARDPAEMLHCSKSFLCSETSHRPLILLRVKPKASQWNQPCLIWLLITLLKPFPLSFTHLLYSCLIGLFAEPPSGPLHFLFPLPGMAFLPDAHLAGSLILFNLCPKLAFSVRAFLTLFCCSVTQSCLFATPWTAACQASLSFTVSRSLLKLMSTELVMPSNHLIL